MGGTPFQYAGSNTLSDYEDLFFLLPNSGDVLRREGNLVHIPYNSPIFHPDLVNASDIVISKVGYSTLAEVYRAGTPMGYIPRPNFCESDALIPFIQNHMSGLAISNTDFESGEWLKIIPNLLAQPRLYRTDPNGADQITDYLFQCIL